MEMPKGLLGKSGVYQIINIANGKIYIGSSVDLYRRYYGHYKGLSDNKHFNSKLQRAWNKYGENSFEFYVIEFLPKNKTLIREREQFWIDKINPFYNISKEVDRPLSTKETPRSISHRINQSRAMKNSAIVQSDEYSLSQSEKMKEVWGREDYREGRRKYYSSENVKKKMSQQSKTIWENPITREKYTKTNQEKFLSGNPKVSGIDINAVREIRKLYLSDSYSRKGLSEKFRVSVHEINNIVTGVSFGWVDGYNEKQIPKPKSFGKKLCEFDRKRIKRLFDAGIRVLDLVLHFNVSARTVRRIALEP